MLSRQPPCGMGVTTLASPDKVMGKELLGCPAGMGWTEDGEGEEDAGESKGGRGGGRVTGVVVGGVAGRQEAAVR